MGNLVDEMKKAQWIEETTPDGRGHRVQEAWWSALPRAIVNVPLMTFGEAFNRDWEIPRPTPPKSLYKKFGNTLFSPGFADVSSGSSITGAGIRVN
jgi:hypothetical protein